ncbi:MAG: amidohydrolase family protein [Planctomycetota bacterium]
MRIDAHQHFWRYDAARYGWIADGGLAALQRDFLPADLDPLLRANGMQGSIAVQARQDVEETEWLLDLAAETSWILGVVGWVDMRSETVDVELERLRARAGGDRLVGLRHVVQDEPPGFLDDPTFRAGVAQLAKHDLTYDVLVYERQMEEAVRFCAAFPDQRLVLDHIGKPRIADGAIDEWARRLRELGAMEHVTCKVSGMVTEADHASWTYEQITPYIDAAYEAFGPERLVFGTDWPVCTLAADYGRVCEVFDNWQRSLSLVGASVDTSAGVRATYGIG